MEDIAEPDHIMQWGSHPCWYVLGKDRKTVLDTARILLRMEPITGDEADLYSSYHLNTQFEILLKQHNDKHTVISDDEDKDKKYDHVRCLWIGTNYDHITWIPEHTSSDPLPKTFQFFVIHEHRGNAKEGDSWEMLSLCKTISTNAPVFRCLLWPNSVIPLNGHRINKVDIQNWAAIATASDHDVYFATKARIELPPILVPCTVQSMAEHLLDVNFDDGDDFATAVENMLAELRSSDDPREQWYKRIDTEKKYASPTCADWDELMNLLTCDRQVPFTYEDYDYVFLVKPSVDSKEIVVYGQLPPSGLVRPVRCVCLLKDDDGSCYRQIGLKVLPCSGKSAAETLICSIPCTTTDQIMWVRQVFNHLCHKKTTKSLTEIVLEDRYQNSFLYCNVCLDFHVRFCKNQARFHKEACSVSANTRMRKIELFERLEKGHAATTNVTFSHNIAIKHSGAQKPCDSFSQMPDCNLMLGRSSFALHQQIHSKSLECFQNLFAGAGAEHLDLVCAMEWNGLMERSAYKNSITPFATIAHFARHIGTLYQCEDVMQDVCGTHGDTRVRQAMEMAFPRAFLRSQRNTEKCQQALRYLYSLKHDASFVTLRYLSLVSPLIYWVLCQIGMHMPWVTDTGIPVIYHVNNIYSPTLSPIYTINPTFTMNSLIYNKPWAIPTLLDIAEVMEFLRLDVVAVFLISAITRWCSVHKKISNTAQSRLADLRKRYAEVHEIAFNDEALHTPGKPETVAAIREWSLLVKAVPEIRSMHSEWTSSPMKKAYDDKDCGGTKTAYERFWGWLLQRLYTANTQRGDIMPNAYSLIWLNGDKQQYLIPDEQHRGVVGVLTAARDPRAVLLPVLRAVLKALEASGRYDLMISARRVADVMEEVPKPEKPEADSWPFVRDVTHKCAIKWPWGTIEHQLLFPWHLRDRFQTLVLEEKGERCWIGAYASIRKAGVCIDNNASECLMHAKDGIKACNTKMRAQRPQGYVPMCVVRVCAENETMETDADDKELCALLFKHNASGGIMLLSANACVFFRRKMDSGQLVQSEDFCWDILG